MGMEIRGAGPVHENGWCRSSVWFYDHNYNGSDDALVPQYVAYYEKPGTDWKGEVTFYPVQDADAGYGVDRVDEIGQGEAMDNAEIDYDAAGMLNYRTLKEAIEAMRKMALRDESPNYMV